MATQTETELPASTFHVLAEPTRRRILDLLREDERPVGELVATLRISQPGVSKHLRVLREAGLVEVRHDAQRRFYRVRAEPLAEIDRGSSRTGACGRAGSTRSSATSTPRRTDDLSLRNPDHARGRDPRAALRAAAGASDREGVGRAYRPGSDRGLAGARGAGRSPGRSRPARVAEHGRRGQPGDRRGHGQPPRAAADDRARHRHPRASAVGASARGRRHTADAHRHRELPGRVPDRGAGRMARPHRLPRGLPRRPPDRLAELADRALDRAPRALRGRAGRSAPDASAGGEHPPHQRRRSRPSTAARSGCRTWATARTTGSRSRTGTR